MIVFLVIGAIGLLLVVLSLILGDFIDIDVGDGGVSGIGLGVGAVTFGAIGALVTTNALPAWLAWSGALVGAAVIVFLIQRLIKHLSDTEDGVPYTVVGVRGVAMTDIDEAHGEVSLDDPQELERRLAWAIEPVPEGAQIVVVEQVGGKVRVERYFPND